MEPTESANPDAKSRCRDTSPAQWLIYLLLSPFWLPLLVSGLFIGVSVELLWLPWEWGFLIRTKKATRFISKQDLLDALTRSAGTLIVQFPTPNWSFSRLWWTDEDVAHFAPKYVDFASEEFAQWCNSRYIDEVHGSAMLAKVWSGERFAKKLKRTFPNLKIISFCSFVFPKEAE